MKVLMFSSDPRINEPGSKAKQRMDKYNEILNGLHIISLDRSRGRFKRFWRGYREAKKILEAQKFDLITAQDIDQSFIAWRLSRIFDIPFQMQIHTDIYSPYFSRESALNKVRVILANFLVPRASCLRVVSQRIKRSIKRDAAVLPIFSEPQRESSFNVREKYPGFDLYLLMVSRLSPEKNVELALGVMRDLIKEINAVLVIVGEGPGQKNLKFQINNLKLEKSVKLEGWQENLSGYYDHSDLLLITSNYEGYNLSAVEALSYGLPVIMTDVGVAGDIVKDGENGFITLIGDKGRIFESILKFFKDEKLRLKLRGGALSTPPQYKSFEDYRDKLADSWKTCRK